MKKKVLLMGKDGAGKTSMYSMIFANHIPQNTSQLCATIDIEQTDIHFLGDLVLNIWDCGGQKAFVKSYYGNRTAIVFRDVKILVYVFDIESRELEEDIRCYQNCLEAILQYSPMTKVFCLIHKMDLIQEDKRDLIFKHRDEDLRHLSRPLECHCFPTSIWDETLYNAWSSIVYALIPNMQQIDENLEEFCNILNADEVLLFEGATALMISYYQLRPHYDQHRFEKISNIIKQFKLSCRKSSTQFRSMQISTSQFSLFIESFPSNTYIMVIMSDSSIASSATLVNIKNARKHFETLEGLKENSHFGLER